MEDKSNQPRNQKRVTPYKSLGITKNGETLYYTGELVEGVPKMKRIGRKKYYSSKKLEEDEKFLSKFFGNDVEIY